MQAQQLNLFRKSFPKSPHLDRGAGALPWGTGPPALRPSLAHLPHRPIGRECYSQVEACCHLFDCQALELVLHPARRVTLLVMHNPAGRECRHAAFHDSGPLSLQFLAGALIKGWFEQHSASASLLECRGSCSRATTMYRAGVYDRGLNKDMRHNQKPGEGSDTVKNAAGPQQTMCQAVAGQAERPPMLTYTCLTQAALLCPLL